MKTGLVPNDSIDFQLKRAHGEAAEESGSISNEQSQSLQILKGKAVKPGPSQVSETTERYGVLPMPVAVPNDEAPGMTNYRSH